MKILISAICAIGITLHLVWPELHIDSITVTLLLIGLVPWLSKIINELEMPGGWKVKFKDKEAISKRAIDSGLISEITEIGDSKYAFQLIASRDKNLALAGLRIEIEKNLIELAKTSGINTTMQGVGRLLQMLYEKNIIGIQMKNVLTDMIGILNGAIHGSKIDDDSFNWAMNFGIRMLNSLEDINKTQKEITKHGK